MLCPDLHAYACTRDYKVCVKRETYAALLTMMAVCLTAAIARAASMHMRSHIYVAD